MSFPSPAPTATPVPLTSTSLGFRPAGDGEITFGSLTVDENSSTPYTDATQVRQRARMSPPFMVTHAGRGASR